MPIELATTDEQIASCAPVMRQLRPHLDEARFSTRVRRQMAEGYRLVLLREEGRVVAVAGFRVLNNLAWGRFLYVDDLVTDADQRSRGFGARLLEWLVSLARQEGCEQFHLDSGVQRHDAHRFYRRHGLDHTSHHFAIRLGHAE